MHLQTAFDIPVVLFIYKRPELTREIVERLRLIAPRKIFVFADGPKNGEEDALCMSAREAIKMINWTDDVFMDYKEHNIGCADRIISGLNETFSKVEKAIIIEDDCIPSISFFHYCRELLNYYENNEAVMHINGINLLDSSKKIYEHNEGEYSFSKLAVPAWGWATWKRAWDKFNPNLDTWQQHPELSDNVQRKHLDVWATLLNFTQKNRNTWDIPWNVDIWKSNGFVVVPPRNLITYKGYHISATHTRNIKSMYSQVIIAQELDKPIVHPEKIEVWPDESAYENELISLINDAWCD